MWDRIAQRVKKPRLTSTASCSGPSTSGYEATAMCVEGDSSQHGLDVLFRDPTGEEEITAASEGERELSEADASSELPSRACLPSQGIKRSAQGCSRPRATAGAVFCDRLCSLSYEVYGAGAGKGDVHYGGPGAPPVAKPGRDRVRSDDLPRQGDPLVSSHLTNSPSRTASGPWGLLPPATGRFALCSHSSPTPDTGRSCGLPCCPVSSQRLADSSSLARFGLYSKGCGSQPPGSFGTSGQLGKEQTLPNAEYLFSQCRAGVGQYDSMSFPRPCTVSAEVCESTQTQNSSPPEILSEAPGAHGILSRGHAAELDAHETATALASYWSPKMGMAPRHIPCEHHIVVLQNLQPLGRHFVPTVRVPLEQVSRHIVVTTDASKTGWGAV
ncbi:hypothetical protein M9458_053360 [Cirrhinus mrigala]|uniref:Uncharacterized protein n=1 Tax=Cirrhinus mrigala TaxID=683832 RepID=A0ABD0MS38_CIRMR